MGPIKRDKRLSEDQGAGKKKGTGENECCYAILTDQNRLALVYPLEASSCA